MNVAVGALSDTLATAHDCATERVNAWRGRCLASFTRVEMAATEALVTLAATREGIALPHMFGQRLATLQAELELRDDAKAIFDALARFMLHMSLRTFLSHGDAKAAIDREGRWQAVFTVLALKRKEAGASFLVIDEAEAQAIARTLGRDRQRLVTRLAQWRSTVAAPAAPALLRIGGAAA